MRSSLPIVTTALLSAALFGLSTPLAKLLVSGVPPLLLAALLYLGSGLGLAAVLAVRWLGGRSARLAAPHGRQWLWLAAAVLAGGCMGPVLLTYGLVDAPASTAALLLNLEGVFTALLAWFVFRENFDRRIALGMLLIVAGGAALVAAPGRWDIAPSLALIVGACAAWALDNNFTRKVSGSDAVLIACIKGLAAGTVNLALAWTFGQSAPIAAGPIAAALGVGFAGYGVSLALFIAALRGLGTARTGAYFAAAPFFGALAALVLLDEPLSGQFFAGATLMAAGVWLHLTERHEHEHRHEPMVHEHPHVHDEHHEHAHEFDWDGSEPHTHGHHHAPLAHRHAHFPDLHHRHRHP